MASIFKHVNFQKLCAILVLVILSFTASGKQIPTVTGIMKTDPTYIPNVMIGMPSAINTIMVPVVANTADYDIRNTIALKYDLNTDTFFLAKTDVRVRITIDRWDASNNPLPTLTRSLSVSINNRLNKPILEESTVNLQNGYKITVTITNIWVNGVTVGTLPRYVSVESQINMDRYYDFSSTGNTVPANTQLLVSDKDCDGTLDEIQLSWSVPTAVPEEYQVEWYYVSNYASSVTTYPASNFVTDFKNNSTRITTTANSYKISMLYPNGYIAFRVRAVGRDYLNPTKYVYGAWNLSDQVNIGSLSSPYWYTITGHETGKNWQYSTNYAEEGKKKEIISYFDGTLHNRQTVTKNNSDKNVIVGETMYDYQGRPAVSALPVPAYLSCMTIGAESAIKYYKNFNVDDTSKVYSKNDFDLDGLSSCLSSVAPMDTTAGASQYYSNNNPNKNQQQAYLPHAKEYPFTQIEYTPDNTGRIRNQSGVGKDYKIGSGRETKYLYGQPNQLQVDRLFGSEAGDASHYKKNIVIDANGQTSVTYLNQEGKTIATALAGVPPTIGQSTTTRLDSLQYAAQNQTKYTVDLFNKNTLGVSTLNAVPPSGDQLDFSTQLLVPFRSNYDFAYNLQVDVLSDPCLKSGVCVSCVYDMEIHVMDECGADLVTSVSPFKPINRVTGNVDTTGNKLTFNTNCLNPTLFKDSAKVSLILDPGVYTVSKTLKVNQQAKDYYVNKYKDSLNNSCVSTLYQFQAAELALIDTSDCYNSCASCVAALGQRDDYVASGKGTAEQWDFLVTQCQEPCRVKTLCQVTYELMLSDVSPGGQYGKFNSLTYDASSEPISVYNVANVLRPNVIPSQQAHWKKPLLRLNGNMYNVYLDEYGVRTKVSLNETAPGVFQPPVTNPALVYLDNTTNLKYTYPENLLNLSDFIAIWNPNYALSLVVFHPEFAYYVSCSEQAIVFPGDVRSSDGLDSLLFSAESFTQAVTAGFINPTTYSTNVSSISKITPIWSSTSGLYDPFFTNSTYQYSTVFNPVTGAQTSTNMTGGASYNVNLQTEMNAIITQYKYLGTTWYTMMDVAAYITRCGNNFGSSLPAANCIAFGTDYTTPASNPMNDTIRNKEWRVFRQLYFAEKQKLQFKRMNFYAKYCNDLYSNYYGGCNACIGNSGYNIFSSGMLTLNGALPDFNSPFFDTSQPCFYGSLSNYPGSTKRFYDPANTGLSTASLAQQLFQATGQCPLAFELQNFLNTMVSTASLTTWNISLNQVAAFSPDLYNAVNGGITPPSFINYSWQPSVVGSTLTANVVDPSTSTTKCVFKLDITGTGIPAFSNIIGINQLIYNTSSVGTGAFKAVAVYVIGSNTLSANVTGSTSCIDIKNCFLSTKCTPNQFSQDMVNLFSYLQSSGLLSSTTATPISGVATLSLLLTPSILNTLGSPNTNVVYQFVSPDKLTIYDSSNPSTKIIFTYSVNPSAVATNIKSFANFQFTAPNNYTMEGWDVSSVKIATVTGLAVKATSTQTLAISLGACDLPDPVECSETEHQVRKDLEGLVNEILSTKPFNSNVNTYNLASLTPLLKSYVSASITATSSTYTSGLTSSPNFDTLTIKYTTSPANTYSACNFKLYHYRNNGTTLNFSNIVSVSQLMGVGQPDIAGNYFYFKALATYSVGAGPIVTDTIYGYSCWPIKNCFYCKNPIVVTMQPLNTYTYSTAFNRANNTAYAGSNNGNFDPYWFIVKTQQLQNGPPYGLIGSPTIINPPISAYDVNFSTAIQIPGCGYVNIYSTNSSPAVPTAITYQTSFTLPNPLPSNKSYSLAINTRADDGIYRIAVNGTNLFSGVGGSAYSGSPASGGTDTQTGTILMPGLNTIEIDAADMGLSVTGMVGQVFLMEYAKICDNGPPDSTFVFPPYKKYDNPCVKQKINLAYQNAANKYQQYINGIITTFADSYTQHCLGALEKFTYKFTDKEYHHTLYYYDQAGNLIKSIPPEGIEYLPITAYTDNLEQKIISDRTTGQQNVFTTHRMATKYLYNSLNQLIFQSLPDHDNMDICNGLNPNGLDTSLVINSIQFVSPNKGYLCGQIKKPGSFNRGYVYTTNDAGNNWTRVYGVTSGDLQKVQFLTLDYGFAVSNFGMVFKTIDGGNKWDLLTGLYTPISGNRYTGLLTDVYFANTSFGIVGGINQGSGGPLYYTNNGGLTFSQAGVSGSAVGDTITGLTYDGQTYVACARNGLRGKIFSSVNGTSWTQVTNFGANNLKKVQFISNSLAFAIGDEGTLLNLSTTISGNPIFQIVPTGMTGKFVDVYFKNTTDGVAIIDSVPNSGKIFKTFDGGLTWQLLSANGQYYNSLQLYDGTNHKLMAAGKNGVLSKVLLSTAPFGITKVGTPNTNEISYADAYDNGTNGLIAVGVSNAAPTIFTCYNAQSANPNWLSINTTPAIPALDATFKEVILLDSSSATPYIKGILLTTNGKLYSFYRKNNLSTMTFWPVSLSGGFTGKFFGDITSNSQLFTSPIFAFDTVSKTNYRLTFAGTIATGTQYNNTSGITKNINSIDIINSGNTMIMVGNSGHIEYTSNIATTTTWADVTLTSLPTAFTRVKAVVTKNFIACGIDGSIWKTFANSNTWYLKNSGTAETLNSLAVTNGGVGLVVGNNGKLMSMTAAQTQAPSFATISSGLSAHLKDVALDPTGTNAYATASNGQVLYMPNYNTPVPVLCGIAAPSSANGVAFRNGPNAVVVGNQVFASGCYGTNGLVTREFFPKGLISLHFFDPMNGLLIDSNNVIRRTTDGGNSWAVILPLNASPGLTKIFSTTANEGVLIGLNRLVARVGGLNLGALGVPGSIPPNTHFYDINYNSTKTYGFIVGSSTRAAKIVGTLITDLGQATGASVDFRAVHTFNNNTFIACGTRGVVYYYKNGSYTGQTAYVAPAGLPQSSLILKDIYFHDDYTGYFVGTNGAAFKTNLNDSIGTLGQSTNAVRWNPFCSTSLYMNYTAPAQIKWLDFNALAFSNRTNLMIGGADTNINVNGFKPARYARLLKEQSGYYSTRFWYDKLGRLVLSQNTKQFNKKNPANPAVTQAFSYTLYDALGRITEVGEKYENHTAGAPQMPGIFGSFVNATYNNNTIDDAKFLTWLNSTGSRREVTKTYYDVQSVLPGGYTQRNLRKRVSTSTYEDVFDGNDLTYNHATHYSYDIHGNVSTLWQENTKVAVSGQAIKQIDYNYDLISGKVNKVIYSPGQVDQFIHRYSYDADNRITMVETSNNDLHYDIDAKYFYYAHGPLARVEYGKNQVQGIDYAYTLQGWIKGVNSNTLKKAKDMGSDGDLSFVNPNGNFARDIMGYTLNYYKGDYEAINYMKWNTATTRFESYTTGSDLLTNSNSLFNGNISSMVTSISKIDTNASGVVTGSKAFPLGNAYRYDQLNRLKRSYSFTNIDTLNNTWLASNASLGLYRNTFSYDANGNIKTQVKRDSVGSLVDSLVYNYELVSGKMRRNRLYHVNDYVTTTPANFGDIKDQGAFTSGSAINIVNNYIFDEIGNLIKDKYEQIDTIRWTLTGKVKGIIRTSGSSKDNLFFDYDPAGNRIAKHVYTSANVWKYSIYYLRDVEGEVICVYDKRLISSTMSYKLDEQHIYGSSSIGMISPNLEMIGAILPPDTTKSYLGRKQYEFSNHLNNVLSVVSDKKIAISNVSAPTVISYYVADIVSSTDYYVFGSLLYGRNFKATEYRYGFNGQEKDDEVKGSGNSYDFGSRIYDPRLGRWFSIDPLVSKFPSHTPFSFGFNNPIVNNDPDGKTGEAKIVGDKVVVSQNIYFYGSKMNAKTASQMARKLQNTYNAAHGTVKIDGKLYKVEFQIKGYAISKEDAAQKIKTAQHKDNFIGVGESDPNVNTSHTDGNTGWWNTKQNVKTGGTTDPHEEVHSFGITGHPDLDASGNVKEGSAVTDENGNIAIRLPQDAKINGVGIDPSKRKVLQSDIDALNIEGAIKNNGGKLGTKSSAEGIYNDNGSIYSDKDGVVPSAEDFFKKLEKKDEPKNNGKK